MVVRRFRLAPVPGEVKSLRISAVCQAGSANTPSITGGVSARLAQITFRPSARQVTPKRQNQTIRNTVTILGLTQLVNFIPEILSEYQQLKKIFHYETREIRESSENKFNG